MGQASLFGGVGGYNTSDANITENDVANGKIAFGTEGKIVGTSNLSYTATNTDGVDEYQATNLPLEIIAEGCETKVLRKVTTSTLAEKSIGDSVFLNVNGVLTEFLVVHQGLPSALYDSSCNGTWLLMKVMLESKAWDTTNNDYENSDIHAYLNEIFLGLFDSNIQSIIKSIKLPYHKGTGSSGSIASGVNGLPAKIFLLSGYEVGWTTSDNSNFPIDGARLSYFTDSSKRVGYHTGYTSAAYWWLRSPSTGSVNTCFLVNSRGSLNINSCTTSYSIRPCLILDSSIRLNNEGSLVTPELILSPLITFTIQGVSYTAYEGMTWGEWVESEWNTDGYYIDLTGFVVNSEAQSVLPGYTSDDLIIANSVCWVNEETEEQ